MFMNTHLTIAKSVVNNIDSNKSFLVNETNFLYGNIKPDAISKYHLKKHYLNESLDMIISKITYLCGLTINCLSKYFSISRFSQEIGVICHFLCDFFCAAHSQRWEMTHSLNKHVLYEKNLNACVKDLDLSKCNKGAINDFEVFFSKLYIEYQNSLGYKNDLYFSTFVCNSVSDYILDSILKNTVTSYSIMTY